MEKIIRELNINDISMVESIVNSRTHQMANSKFVSDTQILKVRTQLQDSIGIFVDDVLDGFILWIPVLHPTPRADNSALFDNPSAYINSNWFMNDPTREKTETGHNLNLQLLLLKMYDVHIERGLYTHWHMSPAGWSEYTANPIVQDAIEDRWNVYTIPEIAPNDSPPHDAYGEFISKQLMAVNRSNEPVKFRIISLKEEFRPGYIAPSNPIQSKKLSKKKGKA